MKTKTDCLKIIECESSKKLMELYNSWLDEQGFSSLFCHTLPCWSNFVNYGIEHKEEAKQFALEYLRDLKCDWVILTFVDTVFGCPINYEKTTAYVSPKDPVVKTIYELWLETYGQILEVEIVKEN